MRRMKQAIKRVLFYLVLGFVMTWLVAWGLAMLPRVAGSGFMSESRMYAIQQTEGRNNVRAIERDSTQSPFTVRKPVPEEAVLRVQDQRWVGVQEVEFRIKGYSSSPPIEGIVTSFLLNPWWTLTANQQQWIYGRGQWNRLKEEFQSDRQAIDSSRYALLRYGFPFMSHEAHAAYQPISASAGSQNELRASGIRIRSSLPSTPNLFAQHDLYFSFSKLVSLPYSPLWRGLLYNTLFYALIFFAFTSTKRAFRHARRVRKGKCPICAYDLQYDNTLGCPECGWRKA